MRLFIAVDFDHETKSRVRQIQEQVRAGSERGRFKREENFHLTLKFLGEVSPDTVPALDPVLKAVAERHGPFPLSLDHLGRFPGRDAIRVIWLGFGGDINSLTALQGDVDTALVGLGFARETKPYRPHVTVAQDVVCPGGWEALCARVKVPLLAFTVKAFVLMESAQAGPRRVYTPLAHYRLCGK